MSIISKQNLVVKKYSRRVSLVKTKGMNKECVCNTCGLVFYTWEKYTSKSGKLYCSKECHETEQKKNKVIRNCEICGKEIIRRRSRDRFDVAFCSQECESQYRVLRRRSALPVNIREVRKIARKSKKYKDWHKTVLERDVSCILCGSDNHLQVDHIKSFSSIVSELVGNRQDITSEEIYTLLTTSMELWDINNGRLLCFDCHKKTDSYGFKAYHALIK